jgi:sugar-specific transcriptional regulator TrmB
VIVLDAAIRNLQDLGLTYTQARIYLGVLRRSPCTFSLISKLTGIARSEIYRETAHLEQAGLVEKGLGRPTIIKAIPVSIALQNLVMYKRKEYEEQIEKLDISLNEFLKFNLPQIKSNQNQLQDEKEFSLFATKQAIIAKTKSMIEEAEAEICLRYLPRKICSFLSLCEGQFIDILRRKVNVRLLTTSEEFNEGFINMIKSTMDINKNPLEVRYTSNIPLGLTIIDKKQVLVETTVEDLLSEKPMLWTNNHLLLKMLYQDFNNSWLQAPQRIKLCT